MYFINEYVNIIILILPKKASLTDLFRFFIHKLAFNGLVDIFPEPCGSYWGFRFISVRANVRGRRPTALNPGPPLFCAVGRTHAILLGVTGCWQNITMMTSHCCLKEETWLVANPNESVVLCFINYIEWLRHKGLESGNIFNDSDVYPFMLLKQCSELFKLFSNRISSNLVFDKCQYHYIITRVVKCPSFHVCDTVWNNSDNTKHR